ncbi:hypothetical protein Fot_31481 [Forsythia ovata]|uniref:Protein ENHANCED DISEASE RESISTANCE 2 C-terminal domain-containing protein n=1 Tax=Forsythia ovata TaxID=205694 RepID=A0ABD1T557_9LAMI
MKTIMKKYSACLLDIVLNCYYHKGHIGNSAIATAILRLALGCVTVVTVDIGFLAKAQSKEELLERLFCTVKICQMDVDSATIIDNATPSRKVLPCEGYTMTEYADTLLKD